jgi:hypothetical protein
MIIVVIGSTAVFYKIILTRIFVRIIVCACRTRNRSIFNAITNVWAIVITYWALVNGLRLWAWIWQWIRIWSSINFGNNFELILLADFITKVIGNLANKSKNTSFFWIASNQKSMSVGLKLNSDSFWQSFIAN